MKIKLFKNRKEKASDSKTVMSDKSKFAIVEAYKSARTNIMFSLSATEQKAIIVTSFSKGDGKSTASSNLAISFAKLNKKVILIDCDLRRPNIHNIFKLDNSAGLSDVIGRMTTFDDVINRDVIPNLDILTSGTIPPNPSELICSSAFADLVKKVNEEYDYIVFDSPPIGVVADSLLLKNFAAGYVIVVREGNTTHGDIETMTENMKLADAKILGFLKVGCNPKAKKTSKRSYYQYY